MRTCWGRWVRQETDDLPHHQPSRCREASEAKGIGTSVPVPFLVAETQTARRLRGAPVCSHKQRSGQRGEGGPYLAAALNSEGCGAWMGKVAGSPWVGLRQGSSLKSFFYEDVGHDHEQALPVSNSEMICKHELRMHEV